MTTHRSFTPEFKAQVVLEVLTGVRSASEACQHYQLKPDRLSMEGPVAGRSGHGLQQGSPERSGTGACG